VPLVVSVYDTEHIPIESVQVAAGAKVPVELDVENVTVPVGSYPVTVAVQVVGSLTISGEGLQLTDVREEAKPTVRINDGELLGLFSVSPE
jgi:hypothetical protein